MRIQSSLPFKAQYIVSASMDSAEGKRISQLSREIKETPVMNDTFIRFINHLGALGNRTLLVDVNNKKENKFMKLVNQFSLRSFLYRPNGDININKLDKISHIKTIKL